MDAASIGMLKLLQEKKQLSRLDAYGLASVAMDCRVGEVSPTSKAIHCVMPKSLWVSSK
jgi:acetamidase/formamidase